MKTQSQVSVRIYTAFMIAVHCSLQFHKQSSILQCWSFAKLRGRIEVKISVPDWTSEDVCIRSVRTTRTYLLLRGRFYPARFLLLHSITSGTPRTSCTSTKKPPARWYRVKFWNCQKVVFKITLRLYQRWPFLGGKTVVEIEEKI